MPWAAISWAAMPWTALGRVLTAEACRGDIKDAGQELPKAAKPWTALLTLISPLIQPDCMCLADNPLQALQKHRHCLSFIFAPTSMFRLISAQLLPYSLTSARSWSSSSGVHLSLRMLGFTCIKKPCT